jgi:hypothetical protein
MFMGLVKRFAPFFITFALGLFIASFFVTIAAPQFGFRRYREMRKCQEMQSLRYENMQLRRELLNQQTKTAEVRKVAESFDDLDAPPPVLVKKAK